jgi:uncharacterized membrane protein
MDRSLVTLTAVSAVGSGVVGGVFFAFSVFVMTALSRLPSAQGIAAMQAVNRAAPTPWFMAALFGTAVTCLTLAVASLVDGMGDAVAWYRVAGSVLYLGAVVLTIVYHVPRNDALDAVGPSGARAAAHWDRYVSSWTAGNHARTVLCIAAAALLTIAQRVA